MQTKNIVKIIPENAVEHIMKFHGEVYGLIPREVWDMACVPEIGGDSMRVLWMHNGDSFCKGVRDLIKKDWKRQSQLNFGDGEFLKFFSIKISIDARNIGEMVSLQLKKPWIRLHFQKEDQKKGQAIRSVDGEGFLKSFKKGIITITPRESPKSRIIAKGPLTRFLSLHFVPSYRVMGIHLNNGLGSLSDNGTGSSEGRSGHYVLSDSDSD